MFVIPKIMYIINIITDKINCTIDYLIANMTSKLIHTSPGTKTALEPNFLATSSPPDLGKS